MTRGQAHFSRSVVDFSHLRTPQAQLNGTRAQSHGENVTIPQPHTGLPDRFRHIEFNPHACLTSRRFHVFNSRGIRAWLMPVHSMHFSSVGRTSHHEEFRKIRLNPAHSDTRQSPG